ncbi:hypothetical protein GALL_545180 [mine drainage metagenome]|uniref:Uncharacterized protein n=1 Tax=mine drainage metagenome TaxID=410659 RepID=A0A1J5NYQ7_9ZZZZ
MIAVQVGAGADLCCVQPGVGFGDAEAGFVLTLDQRGQHPNLLFGGAVNHDGVEAENVDVDGAGPAHGRAGFGDGLGQDRGFGNAKARPAVFLRHRDAKPVASGHRVEKFIWEGRGVFAFQPVGIVEPGAHAQDFIADLLLRVGQCEVHRRDPSRLYLQKAIAYPDTRITRNRLDEG